MSRLISIQVLRAVAALAVALLHGQYEAGLLAANGGAAFRPSRILPWEAGVDIFFVISGFVMVFASRRLFGQPAARGIFLARRIARIVPLYWLTTTGYLALALAAPALVNGALAPGYVLASYAFLPAARPDGIVQPLYSLGWTLNYEMAFYLLLAAAIGLPRRAAVAAVAAVLIALVLAVAIVGAPLPLSFWGDPIILEFGLGMVVGLARADGLLLGGAARVGLGMLGLVLFLAVAAWEPALPRALVFGGPAVCLVAACGLGREHSFAEESWPVRLGAILGDASYALYLIHPFVLRGMRQAIQASGVGPAIGPWGLVSAGLCLAFAAAILIHRLVERPLTALLRAWLEPRRQAAPA